MTDSSRKDWLLELWNFHLGLLPENDKQAIQARLANDVNARTDSERVLELIQQLRQTGHWDFSPGFPEKVLAPILKKDPGAGSRLRIPVLVISLILALFLIWLLVRRTSEEEVSQNPPKPVLAEERPVLSQPVDRLEKENQTNTTNPSTGAGLELKVKSNLFEGAGHPSREARELNDPVMNIESELDRSIQGPLPAGPLELHK